MTGNVRGTEGGLGFWAFVLEWSHCHWVWSVRTSTPAGEGQHLGGEAVEERQGAWAAPGHKGCRREPKGPRQLARRRKISTGLLWVLSSLSRALGLYNPAQGLNWMSFNQVWTRNEVSRLSWLENDTQFLTLDRRWLYKCSFHEVGTPHTLLLQIFSKMKGYIMLCS